MNETEFVKAYVPAFLAAWAAARHKESFKGVELADASPIEDAIVQAKQTFDLACSTYPKYFQSTDPNPESP